MANTQQLFNRFAAWSGGKWLFSKIICWKAPYFSTIKPLFRDLKPGYCEITVRKRRAIENHLKSVHAIAMANMCELSAGMLTEVSIPAHLRWIPLNMQINYVHKAKTDVRAVATAELPTHWLDSQDVPVSVTVFDTQNQPVVTAVITMRVSQKKKNGTTTYTE